MFSFLGSPFLFLVVLMSPKEASDDADSKCFTIHSPLGESRSENFFLNFAAWGLSTAICRLFCCFCLSLRCSLYSEDRLGYVGRWLRQTALEWSLHGMPLLVAVQVSRINSACACSIGCHGEEALTRYMYRYS